MPTASVIVPVYGVKEYLGRCIDSILSQSFADFELFLVDDGSPDTCGRICDEYALKDSRVRVIHKENGGVSSARNAALDLIRGVYVAFCDSDDFWHENYLQTAINVIQDDDIDSVVMNFTAVDETGKRLNESHHVRGIVEYHNEYEKYEYIRSYLLHSKHGWEACTRLFRNSIIQDNHIRFCTECGDYAEDLGFVVEYTLCSRSINSLSESLYFYTMRSGSMMNSSKSIVKLNQINQVSYHIFQRYERVVKNTEYRRKYAVLHFFMLLTELWKLIGSERYCEMKNEFRKVENKRWCRRELRELYLCFPYLKKNYGGRNAKRILLLTHYCLHGNWKRFCYESAIAYKWLIAKE